MTDKVIITQRGMVRAEFNFYVGKYQDKMYDAFEKKKLVGNKCPKCGDVFLPPRKVCGKCYVTIPLDGAENWVDLPDTGTLMNYTATPYKITERGDRKVKKNQLIGMVQIDGSNTGIIYNLIDITEDEVKTGMKLKAKWVDEPKGEPMDIDGFVKA